jgi:diaminopimelate decarboxylase
MIELAQNIAQKRVETGDPVRIHTIDIGGGIHFDLDQKDHTVESFCSELNTIKGIENYRLITEYGAFIHQHTSFVVSRVEYVIDNGSEVPKLAYLHVGADLFLRKVYSNLNIEYPYVVIGKQNLTETESYNVVGPLCFSGDVLYEDIQLPTLEAGDYFVMYNTGANTYSMWSGHCSREKTKFLLV